MRREWEPEDLIACWTQVEDDWRLVANKRGGSRLAFALLLKFFELEGRFPRHLGEVPRQAVAYVAEQVHIASGALDEFSWFGRTAEYHRAQIRAALGFRECTVEDEDRLTTWQGEEVCPVELVDEGNGRRCSRAAARSGWSRRHLGRSSGFWRRPAGELDPPPTSATSAWLPACPVGSFSLTDWPLRNE
jgi:hypothetical protein